MNYWSFETSKSIWLCFSISLEKNKTKRWYKSLDEVMSVYINCKKKKKRNKSVAVEVFQEKAPWVTFDRPQRAINGFGFHVNRVDYVVETDGEKGAWREGEYELTYR